MSDNPSRAEYPLILCGDQIEFEQRHANTPREDRPDWPLPSFDAQDWAAAFCKIAKKLGHDKIDEDWMTTWFANALMRGFDEQTARLEPVIAELVAALKALTHTNQTGHHGRPDFPTAVRQALAAIAKAEGR